MHAGRRWPPWGGSAIGGRPAGGYQISYQFVPPGGTARRTAKGLTGIVTIPVTPNRPANCLSCSFTAGTRAAGNSAVSGMPPTGAVNPTVDLRVPLSYHREDAAGALVDVAAVARALPVTGHACVG